MFSLLDSLHRNLVVQVLEYCSPISVIRDISTVNRYFYILCIENDYLWEHYCEMCGFSNKLFNDISWYTNYKYYAFHSLTKDTKLNIHHIRKCCSFKEYVNLLVISGVQDERDRILQHSREINNSLNIRSQFSQHTGLTKSTFQFNNRSFHAISFYFHILLTFPTYLPSFPTSDSYRDVILWIVDASRITNPVTFSEESQLANVIYNQRYFHYSRKTLHILLSSIAPWIPLFIVVTNQQQEQALSNFEIIKQLKLWREHRIWRIFSLESSNQSLEALYTHCINQVNYIRYCLSSILYIVSYKKQKNHYDTIIHWDTWGFGQQHWIPSSS